MIKLKAKKKNNENANGQTRLENNNDPRKKIKVVEGEDIDDLFKEDEEEKETKENDKRKSRVKKTGTRKTANQLDQLLKEPQIQYYQNNKKMQAKTSSLDTYIKSVDKEPLKNSHGGLCYQTQDEFISKYNSLGKKMISTPDLYLIAKSKDEKLLESLRNDVHNGLITSTRLIYEKNSLEGTIVHDYKSVIVKPTEYKLIIPEIYDIFASSVLETKAGLEYLQALFDTKDDADTIKNNLKDLFGTKNQILPELAITTLFTMYRNFNNERAIYFMGKDFFVISKGSELEEHGCSRGIEVRK